MNNASARGVVEVFELGELGVVHMTCMECL